MLFSNHKKVPKTLPVVSTLEGNLIEVVHEYKYLGIVIDDSLTFKPLIDKLVKKLKLKLGFFFRNKTCFSFGVKKRLVSATFLSVLDYGDVFLYECYFFMSSNFGLCLPCIVEVHHKL